MEDKIKKYPVTQIIKIGYRISDNDGDDIPDMLYTLAKRKAEETYKESHLATKKFGEISELKFSEIEKVRNSVLLADDYYFSVTYTIYSNKLLMILDEIVGIYNINRKFKSFVSLSDIIFLIRKIIEILKTDYKELEKKALLQMKDE